MTPDGAEGDEYEALLAAAEPVKLRNRACETLLTAWAEPWVAFGHALGLPDESPALMRAWRTLLCNQAQPLRSADAPSTRSTNACSPATTTPTAWRARPCSEPSNTSPAAT